MRRSESEFVRKSSKQNRYHLGKLQRNDLEQVGLPLLMCYYRHPVFSNIADMFFSLEQAMIIICGSVPAIKPLIDYVISGRPLGERSQSLRNVPLEPVWTDLPGSKTTTELSGSASDTELAGYSNETGPDGGAIVTTRDNNRMDDWRSQSADGKGATGGSRGGSSCEELPAEYQTKATDRV
jgi:hypothetical protein